MIDNYCGESRGGGEIGLRKCFPNVEILLLLFPSFLSSRLTYKNIEIKHTKFHQISLKIFIQKFNLLLLSWTNFLALYLYELFKSLDFSYNQTFVAIRPNIHTYLSMYTYSLLKILSQLIKPWFSNSIISFSWYLRSKVRGVGSGFKFFF